MFQEVARYALGRVRAVDWLDDHTLIVGTTAGLYRMDATTFAYAVLGDGVDGLSLTADRARAAVRTPKPRRPAVICTETGKILWTPDEQPQDALGAVAIAPDGALVAWSEGRDKVHVVDLATGDRRTLPTQEAFVGVVGIRFHSSGVLLTWTSDGVVQVWDGHVAVHTWRHHRDVHDVRELPDGRLLLAASPDSHVLLGHEAYLWVRELDGALVAEVATPEGDFGMTCPLHAVALAPDGTTAVCVSAESAFHRISTADWTPRAVGSLEVRELPKGRPWPGYAVAWSPSGQRFAVLTGSDANVGAASFRHSLQVFQADGERIGAELRFYGAVHDVDVAGGLVAVAHEWGVDLHEAGHAWSLTPTNAAAIALAPDGAHLALGQHGHEGKVQVLDALTGDVVAETKLKGEVTRVAFAPDGKRYAVATGPGLDESGSATHLFELGRETAVSVDPSRPDVWGLAFTHNAFAQSSWDGQITLSRGAAPTISMRTPEVQGKPLRAWDCAFSPDEALLAVACGDGVHLFDAATGQEVQVLPEPLRVCVAWSPDGRYLTDGGSDGSVPIVDRSTGEVVARLQHGDRVERVRFGPDGKLYSAGRDGALRAFAPVA